MASVNFRLDHPFQKGTRDLKSTPVAILVELYITPEFRPEISTGERILPRHWNNKTRRAKPSMTGHLELNLHLDNISADLIRVWREHKASDERTVSSAMRLAVRGTISTEKKTSTEVTEVVKLFIAQYELEKAKSSAKRYKVLLNRLEAFEKTYPITFASLDFNFYDAFKNWLYALPNPLYKDYSLHLEDDIYVMRKDNDGLQVGLMDEVVFKYFVNLRTVLTWCVKRGYHVHPAYLTWTIIRRNYPVIRLTQDELERLEAATMPTIKVPYNNNGKSLTLNLDICRDYLSIECRTGQRISDLKRFNIADVNNMQWTLTQKKGNRILRKTRTIPFEGYILPAYWTFQKYGFFLPPMPESHLNLGIKEACKLAGINQEMYIERWAANKKIRIYGKKYEFLSTHSGRKTFVSLMLSQPGVSDATVMYLTGIESYKTLKHYRDDVELPTVTEQLKTTGSSTPMMKKVI